uniref:Uncharacterized protein n=1 Tax=viral metagenome TaxID=1070528 RepID=A0A6C0EPP5_9ZZZZ
MATKEEKIEKADTILSFIILIIILIWLFSGIIAFISSLICLGYDAPMNDKILGVIFGLIAGPFYWIYYIYNINYCNNYKYY